MVLPALMLSTLVLAALPSAAFANIVIVRSTGPSARTYPAGQQVADTGRIALRTGDRVVLLGPGGTRTLSGPGNFPAAPAAMPPPWPARISKARWGAIAVSSRHLRT